MAQPSPSPSDPGIGPYSSSSGLTVPVQDASATTSAAANASGPPPIVLAAINSIISGRLGPIKYAQLNTADKTALIDKIWQDPTLQYIWNANSANLASTNLQTLAAANAAIQTQIQNVMGGQGADPTVNADYLNMVQGSGIALTTTELAQLQNSTQAVNAPIPSPFAAVKPSGYTFGQPEPAGGWSSKNPGQSFGWTTHMGTDYGTPAGERIVSPFAGTVTNVLNTPGYGNYVTVTLDNGWKIGFGHVANAEATTGSRVNPGDLIAISGANVGSAVGAVTIVTWQDPTGKYFDPAQMLDPIFKGTTFSTANLSGAAGTGASTVNTKLDTEYPSVKNDFIKYFGTPPSPEDVYNIVSHGNDPQQWQDYIRSMTSHIDGMNMGQAYDLRGLADNVSMTALGHTATDGVVKDLFAQGLTGQSDVQWWYNENSPNEIDKQTYNAIYKANKPNMNGILGEKGGFDPRLAKAQFAQQQAKVHTAAKGMTPGHE
jgi:murein DD-endopeptidase MepM/ murein hydrolase activator NlpD